jgi:hypothetical protein
VITGLPSKYEALNSSPSTEKKKKKRMKAQQSTLEIHCPSHYLQYFCLSTVLLPELSVGSTETEVRKQGRKKQILNPNHGIPMF